MNKDKEFKAFEKMCELHDINYMYSDGRKYYSGYKTYKELKDYAETFLDRQEYVRIWNKVVDQKIKKDFRSEYYWH